MAPEPTDETRHRRALATRRRKRRLRRTIFLGTVLVVGITATSIALTPREQTAAPASGGSVVTAGHARANAAVSDAVDALLAAPELAGDEALEPLQTARADGASEALDEALQTFAATLADRYAADLSEYSDAAAPVEHDLAAATDALRAAPASEVVARLAAARTAAEAVRADATAYRQQLAAAFTGAQPTGGDTKAQVEYLLAHAYDYNTAEWGNYNPYGGDCANFTSQGLLARGWQPNASWYSQGGMWHTSKSWISVPAFAAYLESLGLSSSTEADLDRVRVGDVGVFHWGESARGYDHVMTVSKVDYTPEGPRVQFVSHNADDQYRDLHDALYVQHTDSTARIYHLP